MKRWRILSLFIAAALAFSVMPLGAIIATDGEQLNAAPAPFYSEQEDTQADLDEKVPVPPDEEGEGDFDDLTDGGSSGSAPADSEGSSGDESKGESPEDPDEKSEDGNDGNGSNDPDGKKDEEETSDDLLMGPELAAYIEQLEAEGRYDELEDFIESLTIDQKWSLLDVDSESEIINDLKAALMQLTLDGEDEIINYYPAFVGPVGPIILGKTGIPKKAGRIMMTAAGFARGVDDQQDDSGLNLSKTASVAGSYGDRQYFRLNLETKVDEGQVFPVGGADIVLILDSTSSMAELLYEALSGVPAPDGRAYFVDSDNGGKETVHYHDNEGWFTGKQTGNHKKCKKVEGKTFYVATRSKMEVLKEQVNALINTLRQNAPDSRVAIVAYGAGYGSSDVDYDNDDEEENSNGNVFATGLLPVGDSRLTDAVNSLVAKGENKKVSSAFEDAAKVLQKASNPRKVRVVIHFTDGQPGKGFNNNGKRRAADVLRWAKILKHTKGERADVSDIRFQGETGNFFNRDNIDYTGCGATVYTIGVLSTAVTNLELVNEYMWRTSSNAPDSGPSSSYDPWTRGDMNGHYYLRAEDAGTLAAIFSGIGRQIIAVAGGAVQATIKDYINPVFELCDKNGNPLLTGEEDLPKTFTADDGGSEFNVDYDEVKGCYFVEWTVEEITHDHPFQGVLYIRPKDDFIGGNSIFTNLDDSGVYVDDQQIASFPVPLVNVPIYLSNTETTDSIYRGDIISGTMFNDARSRMISQIFGGYRNFNPPSPYNPPEDGKEDAYNNTFQYIWDENAVRLKDKAPSKDDNTTFTFTITITPAEPAKDENDSFVGTPAVEQEITGTYKVTVVEADLTAQGWTMLKGQTAELDKVEEGNRLTLSWNETIEGRTPPTVSDHQLEYYFKNGGMVSSWPVLEDDTTFVVKAIRNDVEVASAEFTITVETAAFNGGTFDILYGLKLKEVSALPEDYGVTIRYPEIAGIVPYEPTNLQYVPADFTLEDSLGVPANGGILQTTAVVTKHVTVTYTNQGKTIEIGTAEVTFNVHPAAFQGNTFHLLRGEQASAAGYSEDITQSGGYGIGIDYPTAAEGQYYNPGNLEFSHASGSAEVKHDNTLGLTGDETKVNRIDIKYNGIPIAKDVEVTFDVRTPVILNLEYLLFYGETVADYMREELGIAGFEDFEDLTEYFKESKISKPDMPFADDADGNRWKTYLQNIEISLQNGTDNVDDLVTEALTPGVHVYPLTVTYGNGSAIAVLSTANVLRIDVRSGSIQIVKNADVGDPHQTFLFKITRRDDGEEEVFYEYITGSGSATITGLKKGKYTVEELTDWAWRYNLDKGDSEEFELGTRKNDPNDPFEKSKVVTFSSTLGNDKWLGDEADPNPKKPVEAQSALIESALLPDKRNGLPESEPTEAA